MRTRGGPPVVWLALTVLAACGGSGGNGGSGGPANILYVNAGTGSNTNPGTQAAPFRTITRAIASVAAGQTIQVAPGVYDAALGETFPLLLPAGVSLLGDEASKGNGASPTRIEGGGAVPPPNAAPGVGTLGAAVVPGAACVIAGFRLQFLAPPGMWEYAVALQNPGVTLRNNHFESSASNGVYFFNAAGNHVVLGNRLQGNQVALHFLGGGTGTRVESNVITLNSQGGVLIASNDLPDLGGGAAGSAGGNVLSCNAAWDLAITLFTIDLFAHATLWDHAPPTVSTVSPPPAGIDIWNPSFSTVRIVGNGVAVGACP
jgi:hypothetical protein